MLAAPDLVARTGKGVYGEVRPLHHRGQGGLSISVHAEVRNGFSCGPDRKVDPGAGQKALSPRPDRDHRRPGPEPVAPNSDLDDSPGLPDPDHPGALPD